MSEPTSNIPSLLVRSGLFNAKDQKRISAVRISSDIVRRPELNSRRFSIAFDGRPIYTMKFLPAKWPYTAEDILATIARYSEFTSVNVPKLVAHFETEAGGYFVDEFLESATALGELIERGSVGTGQALELMRAIFLEVYGCGRKPSSGIIQEQKQEVLNSMTHLVREGIWGEFILRYVEKTIDENASFLREVYSSGDIIDRNIVLSNGQWYLIDYEYSHKTVFGFKDAFRNILYTRWARNYTLADLYPPLKNFPQDVASMISVASEYRFQTEVLVDQAREVTQKHLRYVFWNALDPMIITQLDKRLGVVEELAHLKETEISQVRVELLEKETQYSRIETELRAKTEESTRSQEQAALLLRQLDEYEKRVSELTREMDLRQSRIDAFTQESAGRSNRIKELTNWSDDLQHQIRIQGDKLKIQQRNLESAEGQLADKNALYNKQVADYIHVKSTISYSIGRIITFPFFLIFKLFVWIYKGVDRVLGSVLWPSGSKRAMLMNAFEHLPETVATGTYLLRMHGPNGLINGIRDTWSAGKNLGILRNRHAQTVTSSARNLSPARPQRSAIRPLPRLEPSVIAESGVSVVIPVLNEAANLSLLLPSLLNQKGFTAIELIVVDSGSTDGSVALAKEYGAKVIQIPPKEFSHSGSRNLGAEQATQEYLLSMTQDALPTSETWIYQMYVFMKKEGTAAVSCMEVPRADVDLFSRVQMWNHYTKFLELSGKDKVLTLPKTGDPMTLRKHAQLTDVACLMKREIFSKYKYRYEYGEDLDLGLRLIRDNLKIGLMSSVNVIHSHRRPPYYHLKRAYVDKLVIAKILNESSGTGLKLSEVVSDILDARRALNALSSDDLLLGQESLSVKEFKKRLTKAMDLKRPIQIGSNEVGAIQPYVDRQFGDFLRKLELIDTETGGQVRPSGQILSGLRHFLDLSFEYMDQTYEYVDETIVNDAVDLLVKQYAVLCGAYIASCIEEGSNGTTSALNLFAEELGERQIRWEENSLPTKGASS